MPYAENIPDNKKKNNIRKKMQKKLYLLAFFFLCLSSFVLSLNEEVVGSEERFLCWYMIKI